MTIARKHSSQTETLNSDENTQLRRRRRSSVEKDFSTHSTQTLINDARTTPINDVRGKELHMTVAVVVVSLLKVSDVTASLTVSLSTSLTISQFLSKKT